MKHQTMETKLVISLHLKVFSQAITYQYKIQGNTNTIVEDSRSIKQLVTHISSIQASPYQIPFLKLQEQPIRQNPGLKIMIACLIAKKVRVCCKILSKHVDHGIKALNIYVT